MVGARESRPRGRPGRQASGRLRQGGQDMGNAVVHFEIGGPDDQPLIAFYRQLFGWDLQSMPGGGYTLIDTRGGSGVNGGGRQRPAGGALGAVFRRGRGPPRGGG